jgi:hypothetical protein
MPADTTFTPIIPIRFALATVRPPRLDTSRATRIIRLIAQPDDVTGILATRATIIAISLEPHISLSVSLPVCMHIRILGRDPDLIVRQSVDFHFTLTYSN